MDDNRSLFERTESLEQTSNQHTEMLNEILGILHNQQQPQPAQRPVNNNSQDPVMDFLRKSKKSMTV